MVTGERPVQVFTVEMHHKRHDQGGPGDNIGMNVKGLDKQNMPRTGDVMVYKKDSSLGACANFNAQIQVLDIPGEIKAWRGIRSSSIAQHAAASIFAMFLDFWLRIRLVMPFELLIFVLELVH